MSEIGDIRRACDIGLSGPNLVVWIPCPSCGKLRWKRRGEASKLCVPCAARTRARETRPITFFGQGTPQAGDSAKASVLGLAGSYLMYFDPCAKCGKLRWVRKEARGTCCHRCGDKYTGPRRDRHPGSRYFSRGYALIYLEKGDPLRCMAKDDGWASEHRIVMARKVGRPLTQDDVVHHVNGDRTDNRECNLLLMTKQSHHSHLTIRDLQKQIQKLEMRIFLLEADNIVLQKQLGDTANPEPSRREDPSGVCRDLTGDTLQGEGEEKVHSSRKLGG